MSKVTMPTDSYWVTIKAVLNGMFNDIYGNEVVHNPAYWDDIRVPVTSTRKGASKMPGFGKILDNGSGSQGVFAELFSHSTEEELYFSVQLPHNWKQGSDLHAHVHWSPVTNGAAGEKVCWGLEYSIQEVHGVFPSTVIAYNDTAALDEDLIADKHYLTEIVEIDMSGVDSVSPMLVCRVFRDATGTGGTDSYTNDAALLEFDFHYQIDTIGSRTEYTK